MKYYMQLSNLPHACGMGNVLVTVSDKKIAKTHGTTAVDYFDPDIVTITDYYAFGSPMPGRQGVPKCYIDTIVTIDSTFVDMINEDFSASTGNFVQISINDNTSISNVTGDELHAEAVWPDNATAYRQVNIVSGMTYTLNFDLVSAASIGSSLMECAILIPGDIQAQAISSGANSFTFTSSYTGFVDIEFSYITDQDEAYSASVPSFDIDNVILTEFVMNEEFESYSVGSFVPNATISPSTTVTNSSGSLLFIGATWPDNPTGYQSVYLENGVTYNVSYDLSYLYYMAGTDTVECRIHLPGSSYVDQQASTGTHNFSFMSNTTGWVDIEFAYLTDQNSIYSSLTPYIEIDKLSIFREILNEDFSSSSTGSFTNNVTGGMPTSSISNPSGVLSVDIAAPFRPATDILVPVTAGHKYSIDFDVVGFSSHSIGFTPIDHSIRCRVEMAGYPTQHFIYNTTSSVPTIIVDVPSGFTGSDIRVEIASVLASSAISSNPYIHIDNFVVKHWVGIENTRLDTVCSAWDKGYRYGFNGKEIDKGSEGMGGGGSTYDYGFRIYNPSLGKFLSVDPLEQYYPYNTPYAFAENDVIRAVDLEGLEKYIVTFRSFIPQPKLDNPNPAGTSSSFKGDNRKYYDVNSTAYRTEQKVSVDFDLGKAIALNNEASGTVGYDSDGKIVEMSESGKAGTIRNTTGFDENSEAITFYFKVDAENKLVSGAPAINADIALTITPYQDEDGNFSYKYSVIGRADGFPAYELFITDVTNGINESNLIFNQNPIEAGQSPWSLFGNGEFKYNYSGDSNTEQTGTKKAEKVNFDEVENTPEED